MRNVGSNPGVRPPLREIVTVVPAKNEEELIGECLESLLNARTYLEVESAGAAPAVSLMVVADACTDGSVRVARSFVGVETVVVGFNCVGAARAHGVALALDRSDTPSTAIWLANTDADSVVPINWFAEQLELANAGVDLMIGTVRPRRQDLNAAQLAAWELSHTSTTANGHVHGANLGVRADRYLEAGGFSAVREHEDVELVAAVRGLGSAVHATNACEVLTSGRAEGRTPGGYAGYLRSLAAPADSVLEMGR